MTARATWAIGCDANPGTKSDCYGWCQMVASSAPVARQHAKDLDWKRYGNKDVCPACQRGGRSVAHRVTS